MRPLTLVLCLFLVGCTQSSQPQSSDGAGLTTQWTDEERAAYEQCLQDNMAVSVAWEVIEAQCAAAVDDESDPLNAH